MGDFKTHLRLMDGKEAAGLQLRLLRFCDTPKAIRVDRLYLRILGFSRMYLRYLETNG